MKKPQDQNNTADDPYIEGYSDEYAGWCVFKKVTGILMEYHAGAFSEKAIAVSEAKRLNDLASTNAAGKAILHKQDQAT